MRHKVLFALLLLFARAEAAVPSCPAGTPVGALSLRVIRAGQELPLPLEGLNRVGEGDVIRYDPELRPKEKRSGDVALVFVAAAPQPDGSRSVTVLDARDAEKPAEWTAPFPSSLAVFVYGPAGLSTRKLKSFLSKDEQLISQLADYAEKTAHTEAVMKALAVWDSGGRSENLGAALEGFAGRYGASVRIDRNAPLEQQTLTALRTLNPALSAYDPIAPTGTQRISQTAGLATTVAGMFFGSTVGLAAGSTALALNFRTLLFPDTDFRSAYAQPAAGGETALTLCSTRDPARSRHRLAYLWAMRIPDSGPPALALPDTAYVPADLKSSVTLLRPAPKVLSRTRSWRLRGSSGESFSIPVSLSADGGQMDIDLSGANVTPGPYTLEGAWDWETFTATGRVEVVALSSFETARPTPASQNKLRQNSGKRLLTLTGADFQFLRKAEIVRRDDRYATPAPVPFTLPKGYAMGPQSEVELQVDTAQLPAGVYNLLLAQADGKPRTVAVKVLPDPPVLSDLPLRVSQSDQETALRLTGERLGRITGLEAPGLTFVLEPATSGSRERKVRVRRTAELQARALLDLSMTVQEYPEPLTVAGAIRISPPRPRVSHVQISLPPAMPIALREGELPAGSHITAMLRAEEAGSEPSVRLRCGNIEASVQTVSAGSEREGTRLQRTDSGTFFLTFNPGQWPGGCELTATVENREAGASDPAKLGRVVRLPRIDSFELTAEPAGDNSFYGVLTGTDLELIGRVGWNAEEGTPVPGLPAPVAGRNTQSLRVVLPWPAPAPHSPLFLWFRGEETGRAASARW